jgi:hypothetical protein
MACGSNENVLRSGLEASINSNAVTAQESFDSDLEAMKTAGFSFIYIVRRKDGNKIGSDDASVIKGQTVNTNRRVKSDEDRAVIIGSNAQLTPDNLNALQSRFQVETIITETPVANTTQEANSNK